MRPSTLLEWLAFVAPNPRRLGAWMTLAALAATAQNSPREGEIQFSNGTSLTGKVSLVLGGELKIHSGRRLNLVPFDQVREIRWAPEQEELAQKWRFVEAGQAAKIKEGAPYPLRSLQATILLPGQQTLSGHLYTTALYVEGQDKTEKVVLAAKQRGKEGETLQSLVYPVCLRFASMATEGEPGVTLKLNPAGITKPTEVVTLTRGALIRLEANPGGAPEDWRLPAALGHDLFLAAKSTDQILVGWPKPAPEDVTALVRANLAIVEDFFDDRQLLGVFLDAPNSDVYSLTMLQRKGPTTLAETRSQPWRLAILRWKYEAAGHRLLLAGQGYLFRGILSKGQSPPPVRLSEPLWNLKQVGNLWQADLGW